MPAKKGLTDRFGPYRRGAAGRLPGMDSIRSDEASPPWLFKFPVHAGIEKEVMCVFQL